MRNVPEGASVKEPGCIAWRPAHIDKNRFLPASLACYHWQRVGEQAKQNSAGVFFCTVDTRYPDRYMNSVLPNLVFRLMFTYVSCQEVTVTLQTLHSTEAKMILVLADRALSRTSRSAAQPAHSTPSCSTAAVLRSLQLLSSRQFLRYLYTDGELDSNLEFQTSRCQKLAPLIHSSRTVGLVHSNKASNDSQVMSA